MTRYFEKRYNKIMYLYDKGELSTDDKIINYCKNQVKKNYNSLTDYEILRDMFLEKLKQGDKICRN